MGQSAMFDDVFYPPEERDQCKRMRDGSWVNGLFHLDRGRPAPWVTGAGHGADGTGGLPSHVRTCTMAWYNVSVVNVLKSSLTPSPLETTLAALPGWSPKSGVQTMGTQWYRASNTPLIPEGLNGLDRWTTESSMKLHPAKCKTMHVSFTRTPPLLPPLYINGHALQVVSVAKLLGVWVQADPKWDSHVNHVTKQSSKRLFLLRRLKKFRLSQKDLLTVYTCYVRPLLEYAAPVWSPGLTRTQTKQLENIQRRACRTILGTQYTCYSEACTQLNLPTLESRRDQLSRKFGRRLLSSPFFREWLPPSVWRSVVARHATTWTLSGLELFVSTIAAFPTLSDC
ncbi:hypothetical protein Bbelb_115300 [Branchiostoma belcheri]|nr:hypothetical protein Bbelb_115300 [Branchiostoma belcheri]